MCQKEGTMGRHESVTPSARPGWLLPAAAVGVVALLGAGGFAVTRLRSQPTSSAAAAVTCSTTVTVQVTTSRAMVPVVQSAAEAASRGGACATYAVTDQPEADTAAAVASGAHPDVWVPDASVWLDEVRTKAPQAPLVAGPSVASSPLVIALPTRLAAAGTKPSWAGAVAKAFPMRTADPTRNASARLALFSSYAALGTSDQARIALGGAMIQLSRVAADSDAALLQRAKDAPDAAEAFPVEESVVAAYLKANPGVGLTAALPTDGTAQFDHPFVTFSDAAPGVASATQALQSALTSGDAPARLKEAGLRSGPADADAAVAGMPAGAPTYLPAPAAPIAAGLLRSWSSVRTEMKMLAVIDTSGSMKSPAGASTRMALAHQAGLIALSAFPSGSSIGLWQLGYRLGGMNQDWRELVPTRDLTQVVDGRDQKSILADGFTMAASMPGGGTGLYDTVLGAYQAAQAGFDPARVNSVVLLTDGFNDDPYSITLDQLIGQLTALRDPNRPIVLITVGIGPDADQAVLKRITDSVGGQSYSAVQPEQIIPVFVEALLNRSRG